MLNSSIIYKEEHNKNTVLFSDYSNEEDNINFNSTWKQVKKTSVNSCQTDPIKYIDKAIQSLKLKDAEVQVDIKEQTLKQFMELNEQQRIRLENFLQSVEGYISKVLLKNIKDESFKGYEVNWDENVVENVCKHILNNPMKYDDMVCTSMDWNSSGTIIASSYGSYKHENWCKHQGYINLWSLSQKNFDPNKPTYTLEVPSCIMSIQWHPILPSYLVGGLFNGDIVIWNINNQLDDTIVLKSIQSEYTHQEPVASLSWISSSFTDMTSRNNQYNILSIGNDGKILVWEIQNSFIYPKLMSNLYMNYIPRTIREVNISIKKGIPLGATDISYSCERNDELIITTEPGYVMKCNLRRFVHLPKPLIEKDVFSNDPSNIIIQQPSENIQTINPSDFHYIRHFGPIHNVECSPFHRSLFLTCGSDGTVHLHSFLQATPLIVIEPPVKYSPTVVKWLNSRPSVFAIGSDNGNIYFYDLQKSSFIPVNVIEASTKPIMSIAFNNNMVHSIPYMASVDQDNIVKIWRLNSYLSTPHHRVKDENNNLIMKSTDWKTELKYLNNILKDKYNE
ncbi:WD40 repeat-like protein [Piromyces finnis]|uniref:WD40 repeat-like protein n=1 Tax=Piromyces finnis TaxID=1754191 RepID=A0A1Y1VGB3_9FUNG|nr:WD40 repeat-like protein [Piromyces finnis]|eukprot:ORX54231.1 WD40 repeat-like protein [Piromyces finnis]